MTDWANRAREAWGWALAHPLLVLGGAALTVVLVLTGMGYLQGAWSAVKDWWFDREQIEAEAERDTYRAERDAALRRAEAAEAQAAVYEVEKDAYKQLATDAGVSAKEAARRAEEIGHEADRIASGAGDLTPDEARALIRAKLAESDRR